MACQYWTESARTGAWREVPEPHADIDAGQLRVRTTATAVSRGTETLVHTGKVPAAVGTIMRAPHQLGDFSFPISYGYLGVGVVDEGPAEWRGARVFGLLPHHSHHVVTPEEIQRIPDDVPDHRALLAGAVETGLNILWQEPPRIADRVAVIGAGMIGAATALLASGLALERLQVLETVPDRRSLMAELGLEAVAPEAAETGNDIVIHTSGTEPGLARALEITGDDGTIVEASWFGDDSPRVPLGADFHARRLSIVASQVGQVAEGRRARRTRAQRLQTALRALRDPRFDALLTGVSPREELPEVMETITADTDEARTTLCHVLEY